MQLTVAGNQHRDQANERPGSSQQRGGARHVRPRGGPLDIVVRGVPPAHALAEGRIHAPPMDFVRVRGPVATICPLARSRQNAGRVATTADRAPRTAARLSPRNRRDRGRRARAVAARGGDRDRLHAAHLGVTHAERERLPGRAPRLRRVVRPSRARRRRLLLPHARGPRRHARPHQGLPDRLVARDPDRPRLAGARNVAGDLPLRAPRPRRPAASDLHGVRRGEPADQSRRRCVRTCVRRCAGTTSRSTPRTAGPSRAIASRQRSAHSTHPRRSTPVSTRSARSQR